MGDHQFGSFTQGIIDLLINTTGEFVTERGWKAEATWITQVLNYLRAVECLCSEKFSPKHHSGFSMCFVRLSRPFPLPRYHWAHRQPGNYQFSWPLYSHENLAQCKLSIFLISLTSLKTSVYDMHGGQEEKSDSM